MKNTCKTGVAFIGYNYPFWMGGINYIRNLLFAVNSLKSDKYSTIVFFERDADVNVKKLINDVSDTDIFNIFRPDLFYRKMLSGVKKDNSYLCYYFEKHNIGIVSHSVIDFSFLKVKRISWLPDFQHLYYPENFSSTEVESRNVSFRERIIYSDMTLVSSKCAMNDLENFCPGFNNKARILHFTAWIDHVKLRELQKVFGTLKQKLGIDKKYFFLPSQFWKHKNHKVVFEALGILKRRNCDILLVCTGNMRGYGPNDDYVSELLRLIDDYNLAGMVLFLGLISENAMHCIMRNSVAVINPSLFEGWSTTVEECKSMGKHVILSGIPVHREQDPSTGFYFDPGNPEELAEIMEKVEKDFDIEKNRELEQLAEEKLPERLQKYGNDYINILDQVQSLK